MRRLRAGVKQLVRDLYAARTALARRVRGTNRAAPVVIILTLLPWLATIWVHRDPNVWIPLLEIGGIIFVYWFFTRGRAFEYAPVRHPLTETAFALSLVALWMLYRIGQYAQLIVVPQIRLGICDDLADTIIPKLVEMVIVPLAFFLSWRYRPRELGMSVPLRAWIPALLPLLALLGWGITHHPAEALSVRMGCFYLGAGLPEELLFRGLVQTRLTFLFKNPAWGLFLGSFVFGVSHLPIDLHGAGPANWLDAFLNAFTFQMGIGFALGFALQRTMNLWPLTLIHALIDAAPSDLL